MQCGSQLPIIQPVPIPGDSNIRIAWGRYFLQGDRTLLPLSVLCRRALVDGMHIGKFYELLDEQICSLAL